MQTSYIFYYLFASIFLVGLDYLMRKKNHFEYANYIHAGVQLALFVYLCWVKEASKNDYFNYSSVSLLYVGLVTLIYPFAVYHSKKYTENRRTGTSINTVYGMALIGFVTFITLSLLSTHLVLIWSFVEATTLCAAVLIYHDRNPNSLEAAWKYFFISAVGLALAFAGLLFLSIASQQLEHTESFIHTLVETVPYMQPMWLKLSFLFLLAGYSVKLGCFPLFTVDIDAKDIAPSPVGALISGGLSNVGFYAVLTVYYVFSKSVILPWIHHVLILTGIISLLFAAVYLLKVTNIKRILAYSSVEHAGLSLLMLAAGKTGMLLSILHMFTNGLVKAILFFQVGPLYRIYKTKTYIKMGNYSKVYPIGSVVLLVGFLMMVGLPPSPFFITETSFIEQYIMHYHWSILIPIFLALGTIFYSLLKVVLDLNYARVAEPVEIHEQVAGKESWSQVVLIVITVGLGFVSVEYWQQLLQDTHFLY